MAKTSTYDIYTDDLHEFDMVHGIDEVRTSEFENGSYFKLYIGFDGATFHEEHYNTVDYIKGEYINMFVTEWYSTDNAQAKRYKERW